MNHFFFIAFLHSFATPHENTLTPFENTREIVLFPTPPSVTVYGYHAYWTGDILDIDLTPLSHIAVFNVDLNSDGTLSKTQRWIDIANDIVPKAHNSGVKVHLCLTSFDDTINNSVLSDANKRAVLVESLSTLVNDYGADGVNIDIEGMDVSQRNNLNLLLDELSPLVDEVFLATPAVDWSDAYDYEYLAQHSDGLFIMGYGYHWQGGEPGPVDPLFGGSPWSAYSLEWSVNDYRSKGVPDHKIILGLPLYGRQWPTTSSNIPGTATGDGVAVVMGEAIAYAQEHSSNYDNVTHTPYVLETNKQLWYPDVDSVRTRISWGVEEQLQGIGFWALDYEIGAAGFWEMVQEETVLSPPSEPSTEPSSEEENLPPKANAGDDLFSDSTPEITLDASQSSDPNGDELTWEWTQLHGPEANISTPTEIQTDVILTEAGTYRFSVRVSDGQDEDTDAVTVLLGQTAEKSGCATQSSSWNWALFPLLFVLFRKDSFRVQK